MKILLSLVYHSVMNRKLTAALTMLSIALSVALLVGVETVRVGARDSFANTISQTDLIVGARGSSLQLLLYAVFHMGTAANDITYETYEKFKNHPAVAWTIPLSFGDSHRGYRVVGTTVDFYSRYRYSRDRQIQFAVGRVPDGVFDLALGSDVARVLSYKIGDAIIVTHGIEEGRGFLQHEDRPFVVVGILGKTNTPIDRSMYVTLEGIEAMHLDWGDGAPPMPGEETPVSKIQKADLHAKQISAFLLRAKSRIDTLKLQRELSNFQGEPLQAIIPGVALSELWQTIGYAEDALVVVSVLVTVVGLLGMVVSLYTSLNERRREMSVLRAIGAGPLQIVLLLVLESALLACAGASLGVALVYSTLFAARPVIGNHFGLYLSIQSPTEAGYAYLGSVIVLGTLIGFLPAIKAYRNSLADGLSIRL
jgi:putative ABC transport system permease protein